MAKAKDVLEYARSVAVVGASTDPDKPAGHIPRQLMDAGFEIIPVNPNESEVFGLRSYPTLDEIPERVDVVEVFRPAEEAPRIAEQAVRIRARALWLQEGIESDEAREIAERAGLDFVQDKCMGAERSRFGIVKN